MKLSTAPTWWHGADRAIVGAVVVHAPLTRRQAERLAPLDLLADEPVGLRAAWHRLEEMWEVTVDLARRCVPRGGRFEVHGALQVVIFEEWAHHQYAERDLALLDSY